MSAIGRMFSAPPPPPPIIMQAATPSKPPPAPPMPDVGSPVAREAALQRVSGRRGGRASTILGGSSDDGKGNISADYSKTTLGG